MGRAPATARGPLARLTPIDGGEPLVAVATVAYVGEGFDCPALGRHPLPRRADRLSGPRGAVLGAYPGKATAEVHDVATPVLAASLAKRAPGYTSPGFPDPRRQTRPGHSTKGQQA